MKVVYKYPLDKTLIKLPEGAEILHIATLAGKAYCWALIDPEVKLTQAYLYVFLTGEILPANKMEYVKTLILGEDALVIHIFKPE